VSPALEPAAFCAADQRYSFGGGNLPASDVRYQADWEPRESEY